MSEGTQRRLAAIVAADVAGYSRLMGADEEGTLAALKGHRRELVDPQIAQHNGRIVKTTGDGLLLEFASVLDAVRCCLDVQRGMAERNAGVPDDRRMAFRVGINLGDIIIDGDDIHGDGVNVAARLEALCEPGGIAVSGNVHEQVQDRLDCRFVDGGRHEVKNIARPVQVWRWSPEDMGTKGLVTAAERTLALPEKPSIAVLPFENLSRDPDEDYLADGITEDIITELSKFRWFFVTARNSTFVYKGQAVDIKRVGQELGVRYVLEGSVRKAGSRIRATAQLIEAASGNHIWAERYDRQLEDIFELQDEITRTIAAAVEPEIATFERRSSSRKAEQNLDAWSLYHKAVAVMYAEQTRETLEIGSRLLREALSLDPEFGRAYGQLAFEEYGQLIYGWSDDRAGVLQRGFADARKALLIDPQDFFAHFALARLLMLDGDHEAAIQELQTSLSLNPNFALAYHGLASALLFRGNPAAAIEQADQAIRLSPNDPVMFAFLVWKGLAHYFVGEVDTAIEALERSTRIRASPHLPFTVLAAVYATEGERAKAERTLEQARRLEPDLSIAKVKEMFGSARDPKFAKIYAGLQALDLPE